MTPWPLIITVVVILAGGMALAYGIGYDRGRYYGLKDGHARGWEKGSALFREAYATLDVDTKYAVFRAQEVIRQKRAQEARTPGSTLPDLRPLPRPALVK